jgi:hypothetical protein
MSVFSLPDFVSCNVNSKAWIYNDRQGLYLPQTGESELIIPYQVITFFLNSLKYRREFYESLLVEIQEPNIFKAEPSICLTDNLEEGLTYTTISFKS